MGDVENFTLLIGDKRITCLDSGIIYLMRCDCQAFYIGKTRRQFQRRIHDHICAIANVKIKTPIAYHMGLIHNFDLSMLHFVALECITMMERGGDWDQLLLRHEARWIHNLNGVCTPGLNDKLSFKPFLDI